MPGTYHKINTIYKRDPETKFRTLLDGEFSTDEFRYLQDNTWEWEEKIDGMNIRVMWDGINVRFAGKSDNAQIPGLLREVLAATFTEEKMATQFGANILTMYGEGCGPKIQKGGGLYFATPQFILFDIRMGEWWLRRGDVKGIANSLPCMVSQVLFRGNLHEAIARARLPMNSLYQTTQVGAETRIAEGLVGRPIVELTARDGSRIITKIKLKDFPR